MFVHLEKYWFYYFIFFFIDKNIPFRSTDIHTSWYIYFYIYIHVTFNYVDGYGLKFFFLVVHSMPPKLPNEKKYNKIMKQ